MSNVETITCDVAGCSKSFAYRIKGFNLCAEHCFRPNCAWNKRYPHYDPSECSEAQKGDANG